MLHLWSLTGAELLLLFAYSDLDSVYHDKCCINDGEMYPPTQMKISAKQSAID